MVNLLSSKPSDPSTAAHRGGSSQLMVMLNTHTTRHLERTLLGVVGGIRSTQAKLAQAGGLQAAVAVSLDNRKTEIVDLIRQVVDQTGMPIVVTMRTADGQIRLGQLRNNALRGLRRFATQLIGEAWRAGAVAVFLDGDTIPGPAMFEKYLQASQTYGLLIGGRVMMTPEQTEAIDHDALLAGEAPCQPTREQWEELERRQARYQRHVWMRKWTGRWIVKPHKPKTVGGNHAMTLGAFESINGADESFLGGFQEDDDLARRAFAGGVKPAVLVTHAVAYHQWHPTRQPPSWHDLPNSQRLQERVQARCAHGLDEGGLPQGDLETVCLTAKFAAMPTAAAANDRS